MPDEYAVERAMAHILLARYLMSKADQRGMTHGEKHHIIEVSLGELVQALVCLGDDGWDVVAHNQDADVTHIILNGGSRF